MPFNPFKQRQQPTFKDRVTEFWEWYPSVADRFFDTIEQGKCGDLTDEVVTYMDKTLPGMAWVFGPGEEGGHSFTVSGEGYLPKQLLAEYWRSRAPEIRNWTFHASRQPTPADQLNRFAISIGEQEGIDVEAFRVKTSVQEEEQCIDIVAWHPLLERVPEEHHMHILFILLDEALGEFGTEMWLGEIELEPFPETDDSKSLAELPAFIQQVRRYYEWDKPTPLDAAVVYRIQEQSNFRRGDTIVGSTCISNVVCEFLDNQGKLPEDPLEGTGAEFAYVVMDTAIFPEGKQAEVRGQIEDAIDDVLQAEQSGRTLGGAFGINESYIDLLLFDGDTSRQLVQQALATLQIQGRPRIESFA